MEETNDSYVQQMLESLRESVKHERQVKRDTVINKRRRILGSFLDLDVQIIKPEQVATIAYKVNHQGKVCEEDLKILNRAFIQDENNINAFVKIPGTVHVLVKELTGASSLKQLAAVECLINLSLGNSKCCFKIAKASGPYLITHLQGMNLNLKNYSVWALGNLLGSDIKTWTILNSQSVLLYILNFIPDPRLQENAIYALSYYVKIGFDQIQCTDFVSIAEVVVELNCITPEVLWVIYLLSCSKYCDGIIVKLVPSLFDLLLKADECPEKSLVACIRILANIVSEETGLYLHTMFNDFDKIYMICHKWIYRYQHLINDLLWLISNIVNHQCPKKLLDGEKEALLESLFKSSTKDSENELKI